ncbi:hypothetical protein BH11ACT8_BH11ACT8_25980 [soil metagenome]
MTHPQQPAATAEPDPHLLDQVTALGGELIRLQRIRNAAYDGVVLETSAFRLLWVLSDGEPRTLRQLAQELDLEQSTINRQANAALDAGYLERFRVEGSASKLLRPTAAGSEAYERDGLVRAARYQRIFAELGPERARQLIELLGSFNDAWDVVAAAGA